MRKANLSQTEQDKETKAERAKMAALPPAEKALMKEEAASRRKEDAEFMKRNVINRRSARNK